MIEEKITGYGKLKRWVSQRIRLHNDSIFVGPDAGYSNTTGIYNTFVGRQAGYNHATSNQSVFIGNGAGFYETANNKLFVDNQNRANEADGRITALIYGVFDSLTANQRISLNGRLLIKEVPSYANSTDAKAGGLVVGEVYKRAADGFLQIVI